MTNIRNLKKDINFMTDDFIYDCFLTEELFSDSTDVSIENLIDNVITARDILISKIHNPENKRKRYINKDKVALKLRKKTHRKEIDESFSEFTKTIEDGYKELAKLTKKHEKN